MELALPLGQMSVDEKLRALERIWDDLCRDDSAVPSPAWHRDVLEARAVRLAAGTEEVLPWDEAKRRIRGSRA
jgi:putative addiction module component (TIGR02574 family)